MTDTKEMQLWWELNIIGVPEPMRITPQQASVVAEAMAKGSTGHIKIGRSIVAVAGIRRLSETAEAFTPAQETNLLMSGDDGFNPNKKPEVLTDPISGAVLCRWAKKMVSRKKWDSYYSKMASYHALDEAGFNGIWMAWLQPIYDIEPVNDNVYPCTDEESRRLDQTKQNH